MFRKPFVRFVQANFNFVFRQIHKDRKHVNKHKGFLRRWTGGVRDEICGTFFPRIPGAVDPPYEATKLLMVQRIKRMKGNPYWLKRILIDLRIHEKEYSVAIVKNTPEQNRILWQVKHLVKITPIKIIGELDENNLSAGYLNENGEFVTPKKLAIQPERVAATEKFQTSPARYDSDFIKKQCYEKWNNPWE